MTKNMRTAVTMVQSYFIFKATLYIVYGSLWIQYMRSLGGRGEETPDTREKPIRCRDIQPVLRSVLSVIAWISLFMCAVTGCGQFARWCVRPNMELFVLLLAYGVMLTVFLFQIQFLREVSVSNRFQTHPSGTQQHADGCDSIEQQKRKLSAVYAWVILLFGLLFGAFGFTGQTIIQQMLQIKH